MIYGSQLEKIYDGELMIQPLYERESWLIIEKADDGYKAFVRSNQFERVFDKPDILGV